jgi:putative membrane protein
MLFGLSNSIIKPILNILTLPIKFLTLGFSSIAINTLLLWGVTKIINFLAISDIALNITDITTYVLSSLIITLSLIILGWFLD